MSLLNYDDNHDHPFGWCWELSAGEYRYALGCEFRFPERDRWLVPILLHATASTPHAMEGVTLRLMQRASSMGYAGVIITAMCAFRTSDHRELTRQRMPEGPWNNDTLRRALKGPRELLAWGAGKIPRADARRVDALACWGTFSPHFDQREVAVRSILRASKCDVLTFGMNPVSRHPRAPMTVPHAAEVQRWENV